MTVAEIMEQVRELSQQEQKELIKLLIDALVVSDTSQKKTHRLSDLRGLGADIWQNVDAQEYVDGLRDERDQR